MPFGMVQLSPDTDVERWDTCSGYHHGDGSIMGFSHTHLSGTGIGDMLDVLVVPTRGELKLVPGPLSDPDAGYRQRYSEEQAQPGYYRVKLESGVLAELTVTERTGWHRYTYPKGPGHVLVDLSHLVLDKSDEKPLITDAEITVEPDGTITGTRRVFRWAKGAASSCDAAIEEAEPHPALRRRRHACERHRRQGQPPEGRALLRRTGRRRC